MATRKRRTVRRRGRKAAPRKRRARRNYAASGLIANPRRRRSSRRGRKASPRRRHFRRNPAVLGMTLPPMDAILFTSAGMIVPPIVSGILTPYLPEALRSSRLGYYTVKAASVLLPSMLVRNFVSRRAGNLMLLGGVASFAIDLIRETGLIPAATTAGMGAQPFLGLYQRPPYQRSLGRYTGIPVQGRAVQRTPILSATPERLSPGARF